MNKEILNKTAEYVKQAVSEVSSLRSENHQLQYQVKQAQEVREQFDSSMESMIKKIADTLYDTDFITDKYAYQDFIKKANQNPQYLANIFTRVCDSKDVGTMGMSSNVKVASHDDSDPIYNRSFGLQYNSDLIDGAY